MATAACARYNVLVIEKYIFSVDDNNIFKHEIQPSSETALSLNCYW